MTRRVAWAIIALLITATAAEAIGLGVALRRAGRNPVLGRAAMMLAAADITASGGANVTLDSVILTLAAGSITAYEYVQQYDYDGFEDNSSEGWSTAPFWPTTGIADHAGTWSFYSNAIGDTTKTVTVSTGKVSFWYQTNGGACYFQVDSQSTISLPYAVSWTYKEVDVTAGSRTLKFHSSSNLAIDDMNIPIP